MAKTWIIVADSSRARVFTPIKHGQSLKQVQELLHPGSRAHERELITDKPGRTFDSKGPGRHAMSESVSPKEHEAWKHCRELTNEIESARTQGEFDRLVLVAAPAFLGALRKTLSDQTMRLVVADLDRDLANMDAEQIREHLPEGSCI